MTSTTIDMATVVTAAGPFLMLTDPDGAVLASGFTGDLAALLPRIPPALRAGREVRARTDLGPVSQAVTAYFGGELTAVDAVAVRQQTDGAFQAAAWTALRTVAPGHPVSYTELAALAGRPAAVRAAAQACARNTVALFVPCHRVLRADGSLGGFRWGVPVKRFLLDHEQSAR